MRAEELKRRREREAEARAQVGACCRAVDVEDSHPAEEYKQQRTRHRGNHHAAMRDDRDGQGSEGQVRQPKREAADDDDAPAQDAAVHSTIRRHRVTCPECSQPERGDEGRQARRLEQQGLREEREAWPAVGGDDGDLSVEHRRREEDRPA